MEELGNLDPDLYQQVADVTADRWTHTDELLALVLEQLGGIHRTLYIANGGKQHDAPKPVHYPRPHERRRDKVPAATREQIRQRIRVGR